jgi:hypothetical protein
MKKSILILLSFLLFAYKMEGQCTLSSAAGTDAQTKCINTSITDIVYTFPAATSGSVADLPAGVSYSFSAPNLTITGTPSAAGSFTYTVSMSDGTGSCTSTGTITVNPKPDAAGTISGTATVCKGATSVAYSVPAITGATSYTWSYSGSGATITGTTESVTIDFSAGATSGDLTVTGVNGCGSGTVSANYPITVNSFPSAAGTITGTATVCKGATAVAYSVPAISGATSYTWSYSGSGATITGTTENVTIDFSYGATSGNLTVTGVNGCGSGIVSSNYAITVNSVPSAAGTITGTAAVCQGASSVAYSVTAISGATGYTWTYSGTGATITGTTENVTISFSASATSGNLTVKGTNGCGDGTVSTDYAITVNAIPAAAGAITGTATTCQGATTVAYSVPAISGATSYTWSYSGSGATITGTTENVTIDFSASATSGTLSVKGVNGCGEGTASTLDITVSLLPAAAGTITGTSVVCQGVSSVSYSVPAIANATSYTWSYSGTGATITGTTENVTISFSTAATSGTLTVKGSNGCGNGTVSSGYGITVNPLVGAAGTITGSAAVCEGSNGISYSVPAISNASSYTWNYSGTNVTINGTTASVTLDFGIGATSGNLTVYGVNSCGSGTVSATYPITVNLLTADPVFSAGPTERCKADEIQTYTATADNSISITYSATPSTAYNSFISGTGVIDWKGNFSGTAYITATATGLCNTTTTVRTVKVYAASPATPGTITGTTALCENQSAVSYSINAVPNTVDYTWTVPSGASIISGQGTTGIIVNFTTPVTGNVSVKANNTCGSSAFKDLAVTVRTVPTATISGTATVCKDATANITFSTTSTDDITVTYNINGGANLTKNVNAGSSANVVVNTGTPGNFVYNIISVKYQSGTTCSNSVSGVATVTVNPPVGIPTAITVAAGTEPNCAPSSGSTVTMYSTTATNSTGFTWSLSSAAAGSINSSGAMTWNSGYSGTVDIRVSPVGCGTLTQVTRSVTVHPLPSVTFISGDQTPRVNSTGVPYTTQALKSGYTWSLSGGGTGSGTSETYSVNWTSVGDYTVFVNYADGFGCTATSPSTRSVSVKPLPSITGLTIDGYPQKGGTLTANYTYVDGSTGSNASTYKWYRDGVEILGATLSTYSPVDADVDKVITVLVTPTSTVGDPKIGTPVLSPATDPIEDIVGVPVADEVCITGVRKAGSVLRGYYRYTYNKPEGVSLHKWYRKVGAAAPVQIASGIEYTVQPADTLIDTDIIFGVIPVSSNKTPVSGVLATSDPIARITGLNSLYSVVAPDVTLTANIGGGFFSGPGVTGNIFSPKNATVGYHKINYFLFIEKTDYTCSQKAIQSVHVDPNVSSFSGMKDVFCFDDPKTLVNILNVPSPVYWPTFTCTEMAGIDPGPSATSIWITPGKFTPEKPQILTFYYYEYDIFWGFYTYYEITYKFTVERVSPVKLLNLDKNYCIDAADEYLSIEGIYPPGGTATWTGSLLTDTKVNSAYFNPSDGVAGTKYAITYQYTTLNSCKSPIVRDSAVVHSLPNAEFTLKASYNIDGGSIPLVAVVPGGVFSGNGVTGNPLAGYKLFPNLAETGDDNITYTNTSANACKSSKTYTTNIRKAKGEITGIPSIICYSNTSYNIVVKGLSKISVSNLQFVNSKKTLDYTPGDTIAVYNVVKAGEGKDTLTFSYIWDTEKYTLKFPLLIDKLDPVTINELSPGDTICKLNERFNLSVNPDKYGGGIYSNQVSGRYFEPSKANLGLDTLTYTYTNSETGCKTKAIVPLKVFSSPDVDFDPVDVCIASATDITKFVNKTVSVDPVSIWTWTFVKDEGGTAPEDHRFQADYLFTLGGRKTVSLTAKTDKGCILKKEKSFDVGRKPEADFYWLDDCLHPGDSLKLVDSTRIFQTPVVSRSWSIHWNPEFSTSSTAFYPKTDTGYLHLNYIVRTTFAGCNDTATHDIYIRPSIVIPADGYFQNFEAGRSGWFKDTTSTWSFGTPAMSTIKTAYSGKKAWYTAFPKNGSASIESPCFDFTGTLRPMIKLQVFRAFEKDKDGVALQYKVGNSKSWQYVGTIDDGIEWYNSATIRGLPGGNQLGWSGVPDDNWKEATHTLDEIRGKKDVKFRLAYGSAESVKVGKGHDGFAFDDIRIGERQRHVLLEHFTNMSDMPSSVATALINTIAQQREGDVINIQYHTSFPGTDMFNDDNPGDVSARALFYGLSRVPYTFVDGGTNRYYAMTFDNLASKIDSNYVTKRTLVDSPFSLTLNPVISGSILSVSGQIKATENVSTKNLVLFLAVTERVYTGTVAGANGEKTFRYIFRKFIPDAGGIILATGKDTIVKGDLITIPEKTWLMNKILNSKDVEIIAFLQNSLTREVYQAFSVVKPSVVVGIDDFTPKVGNFSLYPNPAHDRLTIGFGEPLKTQAEIRIFSYSGELVRTYKVGAGSEEFTVDNPGLKGGIYMVRITMGRFNLDSKKLVISGE